MTAHAEASRRAVSAPPAVPADESGARRDQLLTAAVGVGSAVIGVAAAAFARDTTLAVLVGLVTLCVTPGTAFVCWVHTRDRLTRALTVLATSLTWTILTTTVLALLQITSLGVLLAATAGVGGIGSAIFLADQLARNRPGRDQEQDRPDPYQAAGRDDHDDWPRPEAPRDYGFGDDRRFPPDPRFPDQPFPDQPFPDRGFADRGFADPGFADPRPRQDRRFLDPRLRDTRMDLRSSSTRRPLDPGPGPAPGLGAGQGPTAQELPETQERRAPRTVLIIGLVLATVLFAFSVTRADGRTVGAYGLLPLLGVTFVSATVLTVGVAVLALRSLRTAWPAAVAALALLLVEFNGTPMMLDNTPLASWTYKHFGVVEYIFHGGALSNTHDIYQQWPGFFAAAAALVRLSGRSPMSYANWSQLFFGALNALVLFAIARRFAGKYPVVPYVTVLLYVTANWEGQVYFSPQTTGLLLSLLVQLFLLSFIEPDRLRRLFRNRRWLVIPPLETFEADRGGSAGRYVRIAGVILLFAAIVVTHQLSPYMVFAGVAALWLLGVLRHRVVLITGAVVLFGYYLLHLPAAAGNEVLNGLSLSSLMGSQGAATASSPQQVLASHFAEVIALGLWGATAVCALSYRRRFGTIAIPVILAAAPISCTLVSSYDGEGIYRVFLFSSPWCALVIARRLAELKRLPSLRWVAVGCWAVFAALGSGQAQDFGIYPVLYVQPSEIRADAYFMAHAPAGSVLVLAAANFPSRLDARYVLHNPSNAQNDLSLDEVPFFANDGLDKSSPTDVAKFVGGFNKGPGYLVVGPSMEQYAQYYGTFAPGSLANLVTRLEKSPDWHVWYQNDGTIIFKTVVHAKQADKSAGKGKHSASHAR